MNRFWSANASPDTQAVMTLLLCFSLNMLGRGLSDSFAVFVLPLGREFGWSRAQMMGAYSISLLVFASSAPFAGVLLDRYGHRRLYLTGLACLSASLLGASFADRLWEIYLCVGVLGGIALATLGMIPAATLLRRWFTRSLSTAMGIAYIGLGVGALLIVPAAQHIIDIAGWRWAYRSLGVFVAALALLAGLLPWRRITHGRSAAAPAADALPEERVIPALLRAMRRRMFWALAGVFFFTSTGMFMVIIQIVAYLVAIGVPPLQAAGIFGSIGALSIVGMIGS
ncbi:MAG: MFS transporter, partial [Burkholderiales bacterium]|nr:MFS transporter [Burkholderiales bacterium]